MNHYPNQPPSTLYSARPEKCSDLPVCPACGQLECLCRPRFFAGQLLTEEDLNRLERYVVEKNKLHNRYLHGWGVVCGLEVVRHPCPNLVTVRTGYALSPCGEDIVVCRDETVDVCALIQKCRPDDRPPDCDPLRSHFSEDCREVTEDWILAVCYDEKPSRGVTALRGAGRAASCSRCNCGGSSTCGCSCHSQTGYTSSGGKNGGDCRSSQPNPPAQCEPTVVCEGYSFITYKAHPKIPIDKLRQPQGKLARRFMQCEGALSSILSKVPQGENTNNNQLHTWFLEFKAALLDFLSQYPTYDGSYYEKLSQIKLAAPTNDTDKSFRTALNEASKNLAEAAAKYWLDCFCATLLPPCPESVECNCVALATVKIRKSDCRILQVCNWGPRQLVLTFPDVEYWLSPWGSQETLRAMIEKNCCAPFQEIEDIFSDFHRNVDATNISPGENKFATLLSQAWLNKGRTIDAHALMLGALGFVNQEKLPFANQFELDNALSFLLLNQVVRPTLEATLPTEWTDLMEELARSKVQGSKEPLFSEMKTEIAALRRSVAELQKTVKEQAKTIQSLKKSNR